MSHRNVQGMQHKLRIKRLPLKTICLNMIVKNESRNMVRLLNSAKPIIDFVSIVDTGSTDDTIQVIEKWCRDHKVRGKVHQEPFRDFGYNRTHSIKKAKETFPEADYFLLSDADFVWQVDTKGKFNKKFLNVEKYMVMQKCNNLYYSNIRLLSSKVNWSCIGLTHEHWQEDDIQPTHTGPIQTHTLQTIQIDDREDGGCKTDKFTRDKRLLLQGLEDSETPDHLRVRYTFYLAQTFKCLHEYEDSIIYYQKRIDLGGWYEEVYYSHYQIGINYYNLAMISRDLMRIVIKDEPSEDDQLYLKNWNKLNLDQDELERQMEDQLKKAEKSFVDAVLFCPSRAESLYHCVKMLRDFSRHELAYTYALMGKKITFPVNESLFLETDAYTWGFDYEISILAYYLQKLDEGGEACEKLLEDPEVPNHIKKHVEHNLKFYT